MHQAGEIVFAKIYSTKAVNWPTLLVCDRGEARAQLLLELLAKLRKKTTLCEYNHSRLPWERSHFSILT